MRLGSTVGAVIGVLLIALLLITAFLPQSVERDGQLLLCVPSETAFSLFDEMEEVANWSTLIGSVPAEERQLEGDAGVGAKARLRDDEDRWILLEITDSEAHEQVAYQFSTHQGFVGNARVELESEPRGTVVDMQLGVEFQSFLGRWAVIFARGALDDLIRQELSSIQELMEEREQGCES